MLLLSYNVTRASRGLMSQVTYLKVAHKFHVGVLQLHGLLLAPINTPFTVIIQQFLQGDAIA